uniref:Uncharacterized protein n=1 Tax=Arundo donax TaxID=35708 RepID=A0A0A9BFI1_ARUDO
MLNNCEIRFYVCFWYNISVIRQISFCLKLCQI